MRSVVISTKSILPQTPIHVTGITLFYSLGIVSLCFVLFCKREGLVVGCSDTIYIEIPKEQWPVMRR